MRETDQIFEGITYKRNKLHLYENPYFSGYYCENMVKLKEFEIATVSTILIR